ncbi:MAG TPA: HIT domain-containing protein [Patescibacteria group bacterium]|nr:HIT domain-containing protein [Patescibacteria group bacterium]
MGDCIFCKIRDREIPKEFTYEDEYVMVFSDIKPIKPVHLLIVPKEHIHDFNNVKNPALFAKIGEVIQKMIREEKLEEAGYRIIVNGGGAQFVDHLHFHLTGPWGKAVAM